MTTDPSKELKRTHSVQKLKEVAPAIMPSLLLCDFANLEKEVARLEEAQVPALHLDVMDGVFVPNLTYGMPIVETFRKLTDMPIDAHLMIQNPTDYIPQFHKAGADIITFHAEAVDDPRPALELIRSLGIEGGLAINPGTPISVLESHLDLCDLVLIMSVEAGFGGQSFNPVALEKLAALKKINPDLVLQIDGGVNTDTIARCRQAGADLFVAGSSIFKKKVYSQAVSELIRAAKGEKDCPH
ncbi:MAG: ribulose-phosphate 3-epimerase [Pirellulaceae bacterium]|nr:ribulose-phosphate 3-epimerase [Pirellulaceae bacterium]